MHNEVPPPPNLRGRGRGGNIRGRGRGRGFGGANHGGYMNAGEDACRALSLWTKLAPRGVWGPWVALRCWERQVQGRPTSSPGNPVCSLPGAGYGSYGYGGNSATAGYSKYLFLFV